MSFGSKLKELRIERNTPQKTVAKEMGVSITAISQYESDNRFPNEETLKRLCIYYQISSDYLLGLTDTKHAPLSREEAKEKMISCKEMDFLVNIIDFMKNKEYD